jgi:hypothetical protein
VTARNLVESTLRLIGVLASGETAPAAQANDALTRLNGMLKSWNIEGLMVYKTTREEFPLIASQQSVTMGTGGDFDTTRPSKITGVGVMISEIELPVDIITVEEWAKIVDKGTGSTQATKVYVEGTYPLETLNFWPMPTANNTVVIYSQKPIASTLALADTLSMPDGYELALEYNLALFLAPEFGRQIDPMIFEQAKDLKAALMRQNTKASYMTTDAPGGTSRRWNMQSGQ